MFQRTTALIIFCVFIFYFQTSVVAAKVECKSVEEKKVKVEGFISKKFKKARKKIAKEFSEMGNTRTALRVFPMGDTSDVVAVGRCVPARIAQHVIRTATKYTKGVGSLVVQEFLHGHWIGVGITMFDEPSQKKVTAEQVQQLLDPDLGDKKFHMLYRKLSKQNELVPYFGLKVPNVKIPGASTTLSP